MIYEDKDIVDKKNLKEATDEISYLKLMKRYELVLENFYRENFDLTQENVYHLIRFLNEDSRTVKFFECIGPLTKLFEMLFNAFGRLNENSGELFHSFLLLLDNICSASVQSIHICKDLEYFPFLISILRFICDAEQTQMNQKICSVVLSVLETMLDGLNDLPPKLALLEQGLFHICQVINEKYKDRELCVEIGYVISCYVFDNRNVDILKDDDIDFIVSFISNLFISQDYVIFLYIAHYLISKSTDRLKECFLRNRINVFIFEVPINISKDRQDVETNILENFCCIIQLLGHEIPEAFETQYVQQKTIKLLYEILTSETQFNCDMCNFFKCILDKDWNISYKFYDFLLHADIIGYFLRNHSGFMYEYKREMMGLILAIFQYPEFSYEDILKIADFWPIYMDFLYEDRSTILEFNYFLNYFTNISDKNDNVQVYVDFIEKYRETIEYLVEMALTNSTDNPNNVEVSDNLNKTLEKSEYMYNYLFGDSPVSDT